MGLYFFDAAVDVDGLGEFYPINLGRLFALTKMEQQQQQTKMENPDPNGEYLLPVSVKDEAGGRSYLCTRWILRQHSIWWIESRLLLAKIYTHSVSYEPDYLGLFLL